MEGGSEMFFGEFSHSVDDKGRVLLPQRFRNTLGDKFIVTIGVNKSLMVLSSETFEAICYQLIEQPLAIDELADFSRMFASSAVECEPDKQGRILLPGNLRQHANIGKNLVFAGVINRVEIWEDEQWAKYKAGSLPKVDLTLDSLKLKLPMPGEKFISATVVTADETDPE